MSTVNPFFGCDVRWLLDTRADERGDHEFLVWRPHDGPRRAWSYDEFRRDVDRLGAALQRRGIDRGVQREPREQKLRTIVHVNAHEVTIGAVIVTTNTRSSVDELTYFLQSAHVEVTITQIQHAGTVGEAIRHTGRGRMHVAGGAAPSDQGAPESEPFDALLAESGDARRAAIDPEAAAGVQFTSGTTSRPKGVVWTHANYLWAGKVGADHELLRPDDRYFTYLPLCHTNAQSYSVMASLWVGATIVLTPGFSASRFWDVALTERTTWRAMVPFSVKALRRHATPADHSFRCWGNGIIVSSWEKKFGIPTLAWWGMTETVSHPIVSDPGITAQPMSMGRAATEYAVQLVDEAGTPIHGPGVGLLEVHGVASVSLMLGYLHDPDATAAAFTTDGWLRTGDRVELHDDGWFGFLERDKDMLKIGGENVAALEIERVISGVRGVHEVAIVAGSDPMLDELPVAFVIASPNSEELVNEIISACQSALADFKVPRLVVIVDERPRSTLNKMAKNLLRADADLRLRALSGAEHGGRT